MNYSSCWQVETNRKLAKGNEILQQIYQQLHKATKFYRNEQWYYFRYPTKRKRYLSVILLRLQRKAFFLACKHTLAKILPPFSKDKRSFREIQYQWPRKQAGKY